MRLRAALLAVAALAWARPAPAAEPTKPASTDAPGGVETGPAIGWVFPVFTDQEGYHKYTLRGTTARVVNSNQIDVTGFTAIVFSGDASERVDNVLLSPQATFYPKDNRAGGSNTVRLILSDTDPARHNDIEVLGRGWTYDAAAKKVFLAHDVRVTFQAQLNDILK